MHQQFWIKLEQLFLADGVLLSKLGTDLFFNNFYGAIKQFLGTAWNELQWIFVLKYHGYLIFIGGGCSAINACG